MTRHHSTSPTARAAAPTSLAVLVWDLPTRLFHWLLAASFLGAYIVSEGDRWRGWHALLGYTAGGLIAFRLLWGVLGTRYARFSSLALQPAAARAYLRSLLAGAPEHHVGHNPAGSWAVLALLGLVALTAVTGWATLNEVGPHWLDDVHELFGNATFALAAVHVAAVLLSSLLHRENLVRAMLTGTKRAPLAAAAAGPRRAVALLLVIAVFAFWSGWIPAPGIARGAGLAGALRPVVSETVNATVSPGVPGAPGRHRRHHDD
jgi:cytochrome b